MAHTNLMTIRKNAITAYTLLGTSAILYIALAYATPRENFTQLLLLFGSCFIAYVYVITQRLPVWHGITAAIVFRVLFLFATPQLSDDYFRFIWDGRLLAAGINPYLYLPEYFMQQGQEAIAGINQALYSQLNSPGSLSISPPIAQAVFWLSVKISPDSIAGSVVVMRLVLIVADVLGILLLLRLLRKTGLPDGYVLLYALNPLVILELTGNLHFEGLLIFFLLLSLIQLLYQRAIWAGCAFGLAAGVHLLPLLFLPFIWRKLGTPKFLYFIVAAALTLLVICYPLINAAVLQNIGNWLELYFKRPEFNASIYFILRWVGIKMTGYNQVHFIIPLLSIAIIGITVALAAVKKLGSVKRLIGYMAAALTVFLLLSTTVHPWYLITLVALTAVGLFRFAIVWSGLAILSYATYRTAPAGHDLALVTLEYTIVLLWLLVEIYLYRQRRRHANLK
ncbi:hypothetical protein WG947_08775 [Pontibacter sp. H259]|uniref:hypothetical protein n=1 Tax=Pontibacter sp. H259 TaxID=3133421 RepID=UPI0030C13782